MRLNPPSMIIFLLSLACAVIAVLAFTGLVRHIPVPSFWIMTGGYVLLLLGNILRGL